MQSQFKWLKDEQARLRKNGKGSWRDDLQRLAVLGETGGVSQLMGNTGYGEDGKLQPNMPTGIFQTGQGPRMIHEGENMIRNPDGSVTIVPARQSQLLDMQRRTGMPGMQTGGEIEKPIQYQTTPTTHTSSQIAPVQSTTPTAHISRPISTPVSNTHYQTPIAAASVSAPRTIATQKRIAPPINYTPPTIPSAPPSTQFGGGYWGRGMQRLERYSEGRAPYDTQIYNQTMGQFKGEEAASRGALEQQMAQTGLTGREAATERYMAGLGIGAQESQVIADLRKQQSDRAFTAAQQIPGQALAGDQFAFEKQKYGDTEYQRLSADIKSGMSYEQAAAKYPNLTQDSYNKTRGVVLFDQMMEGARSAISARDWATANTALQNAGLPQIDFTTADSLAKAGDFERSISMLQPVADVLTTMGVDAPPGLVSWYSEMVAQLALGGIGTLTTGTGATSLGVLPVVSQTPKPIESGDYAGYTMTSNNPKDHTYTFTGSNGETVTLSENQVSQNSALLNAIPAHLRPGDPQLIWDDAEVRAIANHAAGSMMDWYTNSDPTTGGALALQALRDNAYFSGLLDVAMDPNKNATEQADAWETIGAIMSYRQSMTQAGYDVTTALNSLARNDPKMPDALVKAGVISPQEFRDWQKISSFTPTTWSTKLMSNNSNYNSLDKNEQKDFLEAYEQDPAGTLAIVGNVSLSNESGKNFFDESTTVHTSVGDSRWVLTDDAKKWARANMGKPFEYNGALLAVTNMYNPAGDAGRGTCGYIEVKDLRSGKLFYLWRGGWTAVKPSQDQPTKSGTNPKNNSMSTFLSQLNAT